jgi:hypothetical protein
MWKLLLRHLRRPARARAPSAPALPAAQEDDRPLGCGWFDSSHELAQGAAVTELDDAATPLWRWAALAQA